MVPKTSSSTAWRAAPFVVGLATLLAGLWWVGRGAEEVADRGVASAPVDDEEPAALAGDDATAPAVDGDRPAREAAGGAPADVGTASDDAPPDDRLTGVVVDGNDLPIGGARVVLDERALEGFTVLDVAENRRFDVHGEVLTDADGEFAFDVPPGRAFRLTAGGIGHAAVRETPAFGGNHYRLVLGAQAVLEGRLTRASDGAPVVGARLRGWLDGGLELFRGESEADGTFRFAGLQAGRVTVDVKPLVLASPKWSRVDLRPGETTRLDLALEDGVTVSGRITDARTGLGLPGAEVGAGWTFARSTRADGEGRYELRGFGGPGVYEIHARADGYGRAAYGFDYRTSLPTEDVELDFELHPARVAVGRVVDESGAPLAGVVAAGVATAEFGAVQGVDRETVRTGVDGRFRFESLDPRLRHQLLLRRAGHGTRVLSFPTDELERDFVDLGDVALVAAARIAGRLLTGTGSPMPGRTVTLHGLDAGSRELLDGELAASAGRYTAERATRTDPRGRFHFADLGPGTYHVGARLSSTLPGANVEVTLDEGELRDDVELVLSVHGRVAGRLLDADGRPVSGATIRAHEPGSVDVFVSLAQGRTDLDGRFELFGVAVDEVLLETDLALLLDPDTGDEGPAPAPPVLAEVDGTEVELRLRRRTTLEGRAVERDGTPIVGARARARFEALPGVWLDGADTGEDGEFALRLPAGVEVELEVRVPVEQGADAPTDAASPPEPRVERRSDVRTSGPALEVRFP